jgi:uncharacterized membrane protein YcaP (DUF421 family)
MNRERVSTSDIREAARLQLGLEQLSQIKLAVLERSGRISVVPRQKCLRRFSLPLSSLRRRTGQPGEA